MDAKQLRDMVTDFSSWGGNTFTLAMLIMQKQKEDDAVIAESLGQDMVADAIRNQ